jgi:UPF0716 family protein affecting phage T7 exclusion
MFWFTPIFALLVLIPAVRLLRRGGHSPWSALLLLIPFVNVAFIWWLAFARSADRSGNGHGRGHCGPARSRKPDAVVPPASSSDVPATPV